MTLPVPRTTLGRLGACFGGFFALAMISAAIGTLGESDPVVVVQAVLALAAVLLFMAGNVLVLVALVQGVLRSRRRGAARRIAAMPGAVPYVFNPPPGWPRPAEGWLPAPGWDPDPAWPVLPEGWQLWVRTASRPRHLPRSPWDPHPSDVRTLDAFDGERLRTQLTTLRGRMALRVQVMQTQLLGLEQRLAFDDQYRADAGGRTGRSRWHPAEWAFRHAAQGVIMTASSITDRLAEVDHVDEDPDAEDPQPDDLPPKAPAAQDPLMPATKDELVSLAKSLAGWTDELFDAAHERVESARAGGVARGPAAPGLSSATGWQDAEHVAAAALRQFGFSDAAVTGPGTDGGIDVAGRSIAAQVKYTGAQVGRPLVQQLAGAAGGRRTAFFSRSGYTKHALDEAERLGMALFTVTLPDSVTGYNGTARNMARQG